METSESIASPIDFERLREVSDNDAEVFYELVELYFSETGNQLIELKGAVEEKDFDSIYRAAHKILGSSLTCGMNKIVPPLQSLEQDGKNRNSENAGQLFEQTLHAFEQMREFFNVNKSQIFS